MEREFDRITRKADTLNGQPCIRGMRITVKRVLELISLYPNREELFKEFPELEPEDLDQALAFAAASIEDRIINLQTA